MSGLLVAPMTTTPSTDSTPSISFSSVDSTLATARGVAEEVMALQGQTHVNVYVYVYVYVYSQHTLG